MYSYLVELLELIRLGVDNGFDELLIHCTSIVQCNAVFVPLPHLRATNLGSGGVFHEIVDWHAALTGQPGGHVLCKAVYSHIKP